MSTSPAQMPKLKKKEAWCTIARAQGATLARATWSTDLRHFDSTGPAPKRQPPTCQDPRPSRLEPKWLRI
eukprot:10923009-Prorocentrum_lima.AAC.1